MDIRRIDIMSKKKRNPAKQAQPVKKNAPRKAGRVKPIAVVCAIVLVFAVGAFVLARTLGGGNSSSGGTQKLTAPADEAKYIGRYLPAGYAESKVGGGGAVTSDIPMKPVVAATGADGLTVALSDVTAARNVSFEYKKADGSTIPLMAYVKPSGKLFVGVSYCVPCKGAGQTLTADGKLTCDSCGTKRDPESGIGISGTCKLYPLDELPAKVVGGKIVVDKAALEGWTEQPLDRKVG